MADGGKLALNSSLRALKQRRTTPVPYLVRTASPGDIVADMVWMSSLCGAEMVSCVHQEASGFSGGGAAGVIPADA